MVTVWCAEAKVQATLKTRVGMTPPAMKEQAALTTMVERTPQTVATSMATAATTAALGTPTTHPHLLRRPLHPHSRHLGDRMLHG